VDAFPAPQCLKIGNRRDKTMKRLWGVIAAGIVVACFGLAGPAFARDSGNKSVAGTIRIGSHPEEDFPSLTQLTMDQAIQKALYAVQGKVLKTALENENGFLVYSVEVVTPEDTTMRIEVDAGSGEVLSKVVEEPENEKKEANEGDDEGEGEHYSQRQE
jgi:hypothetical protein